MCRTNTDVWSRPSSLLALLLHNVGASGNFILNLSVPTFHTTQGLPFKIFHCDGVALLQGNLSIFDEDLNSADEIPVSELLIQLYKRREWLCLSHLLLNVARLVEKWIAVGQWDSDVSAVLPTLTRKKRSRGSFEDPNIKIAALQMVRGGQARNLRQLRRTARALGIKMPSHNSAEQATLMQHYHRLIKAHKAQNNNAVCISVDGKRLGGRHYLAGAGYFLNGDICFVPPPQVCPGHQTHLDSLIPKGSMRAVFRNLSWSGSIEFYGTFFGVR